MLRLRSILFAASLPWLSGCGYVGEPLPPTPNVPRPVTDLRAVQHGDTIVVDFTIPPLTTDGLVLKHLGTADLQIGDKPVPVTVDKTGPVHVETPARNWIGQEPNVRVRISNANDRFSNWSNYVTVAVVEPLDPPADVKAQADPKGVRLTWRPEKRPGVTWRVTRGKDEFTSDHPEFIDTGAQYGTEYKYQVVAILKTVESDPSPEVVVTPKDVFPPAVPAGLTALTGVSSIELSWERNTEEDLKGYHLFRAQEGGAFQPLGDLILQPSYSDKQIQPGKKYRYTLSAADQSDNESGRCPAIEALAP
jgi:hypothetical protein